jgi:membrane-associated phospholipid phosphatase
MIFFQKSVTSIKKWFNFVRTYWSPLNLEFPRLGVSALIITALIRLISQSLGNRLYGGSLSFLFGCLSSPKLVNFIRKAGDFFHLALPISGLLFNAWEGRKMEFRRHSVSVAITAALTQVIKYLSSDSFLGRRPDGGSLFFPEGHTSSAFSTVMFFSEDLNSKPATAILYGLAIFTGCSRVIANRHHPRDVIVGAALPLLVSYGIKKLNCGFGLSDEEQNVSSWYSIL